MGRVKLVGNERLRIRRSRRHWPKGLKDFVQTGRSKAVIYGQTKSQTDIQQPDGNN